MTTYSYQLIAADLSGAAVPFAVGSLYAEDDSAFANPLTITSQDGTVGTTTTADRTGVVRFTVEDVIRCLWKSGSLASFPVAAWQAADQAAAAALASANDSAASKVAAQQAAALVGAPAGDAVAAAVNGSDFTPTGSWDFTGANLTGVATSGGTDMTITDQGTYYEFDVVDGGNVAITDNDTYWTITVG